MNRKTKKNISAFVVALTICSIFACPVFAETSKTGVFGDVYEFDKDSHYEFNEAINSVPSDKSNTYGNFGIGGQISNITTKDGVPAYEISEGKLSLYYTYGDTLLRADEESWHLIDDKSKKIDNMTLKDNIMKGAMVLQTSKDRKTWVDVNCTTNAFATTPIQTDSFYSTTDIQLINGCYYRLLVAYETRIKVEPNKFLFITIDKFDYKKCTEVYEFYAFSGSENNESIGSPQKYSLGKKVRTEHFDGYSGGSAIEKNDDHYGWDLGNFFVSGYTGKVDNKDGNAVFLKNVGDKVTLWFNLEQNINALRGNNNITISSDTAGYDQYFETPKMNLGRGVLITRYTDYNNISAEPTIYTNYLEANATVGMDTKVQLFEEGDYEVALDYEITNDKLIDTVSHYRIFFKFLVRNGNCMVYPFDVVSGNELTNSAMTANGFRLDLANSRYLKINLKRETLKDSADGLVEDTRFNGAAKDGSEYTEEGIYTITVSNEYTGQFTVKKIYVGENSVLQAYVATGLSIPEINNLLADGATISEDGTIKLASATLENEESENTEVNGNLQTSKPEDTSSDGIISAFKLQPMVVGVVCIVLCGIFVATINSIKRRKEIKREEEKDEGENEQ